MPSLMKKLASKIEPKIGRNRYNPSNIYVVFDNRESLEEAVEELKAQGFFNDEIIIQRSLNGKLLDEAQLSSTKTAEGAILGIVIGTLVGAVGGALLGFTPSPETNNWISSAIVLAASCGLVGGVVGGIVGLVIPEFRADQYNTALREGAIVVKVEAKDPVWAEVARTTVKKYGGEIRSPREILKEAS